MFIFVIKEYNGAEVANKILGVMGMIAFFMVFPALFMVHEMEELIFMPRFVPNLPASKATKKVQAY